MVSEDLDDFSVDVVEFDDGTKVQVGSDASSVGSHTSASGAKSTEPVLPSERFTDDYDRSYPPKQTYHHHHPHYQKHHDNDQHHANYKPYRRSEDHGYSSRYSNTNYNSRRHSSTMEGGSERRISSTSSSSNRWTSSSTTASTRRESMDYQPHYGNRRSSYDKKHDNGPYHPTSLLQRPRRLSEQSFRSDHSREEISSSSNNPLHIIPEPADAVPENTEEIIVVQKNLMLTAAERAKKRLEEQEAEFKAAAERAKQKADALAAKQAELKEKTILKKPVASADTATLDKATSPSAVLTTNKASAKASALPKSPLPPKLPDTSKPWNLVAANKQIPTTPATTSSASTSTAAPAPSANEDEPKEPPLQTPKEPSPISTSDAQPSHILSKEQKPVTIMKKVAIPAVKEKEKKEEKEDKSKKPLTEDEKKWQKFVSTIKTDQNAAVKEEVTSTDWNSYADRLQETTAEQDAIAASTRERLISEVEKEIQLENQQHKQQQPVEVFDYEDQEWGAAPVNLKNTRGAWTRDDNTYNQQRGHHGGHRGSGRTGRGSINRDMGRASNHSNGRGRTATNGSSTGHWHHDITTDEEEEEEEEKPMVVEILKKQEPVLSKKTRLTNLLKESSSPIFPDFIDKLAAKKPANMSFMVDTEESDKEITMMGQGTTAAVEDEAVSVATTNTTTTENSPASTPPKSQQHQRKMNVNRHFPVLVYQYPNQSASIVKAAETKEHLGSPSASMDVGSKSKLCRMYILSGIKLTWIFCLGPSSHHQQSPQNRPLGVYLMPQQPYLAANQYVVPYPQVGAGNMQHIYYPPLPWQQQHTSMSPGLSYDHHQQQPQHLRRSYNNNYNDYRQHKYPHNPGFYQNTSHGRGNSYRKRGGSGGQRWSGSMVNNAGRGGGGAAVAGRGHYQNNYNSGYNKRSNRNEINTATSPPTVDMPQSSSSAM